MSPTSRIPDNSSQVRPRLFVTDADAAIAIQVDILDAVERGGRLRTPDGCVLHAELLTGDSLVMVSVGVAELGAVAPTPSGTSTVTLHTVVVVDDEVVARAQTAGARVLRAPHDEFYGDRTTTIADPFRHRWGIAAHVDDVDPQEMSRRVTEIMRSTAAWRKLPLCLRSRGRSATDCDPQAVVVCARSNSPDPTHRRAPQVIGRRADISRERSSYAARCGHDPRAPGSNATVTRHEWKAVPPCPSHPSRSFETPGRRPPGTTRTFARGGRVRCGRHRSWPARC